MRLLVTGGGTGGHVYPALVVVETLLDGQQSVGSEGRLLPGDVAWVGRADSVEERLVTRMSLPFWPIDAGALRGVAPLAALANLVRLVRGTGQARRILRRFRPDVVLATGGYVSVPLVLAAALARCPVMIYLPDIEPGLAVRLLSGLAQKVAVSFAPTAKYLSRDKVFVSGYPVRQGLYNTDKQAARQSLGLRMDRPVLLVFGGSRGAHSINLAVGNVLAELLTLAQVVHVSGEQDYGELTLLRGRLPEHLQKDYYLYDYLHEEMVAALVASDLTIARAGAATLGEFPAAGLPAILVPYPYSGQHQQLNADYMASRGAARVIRDQDLGGQLLPAVAELLATVRTGRATADSDHLGADALQAMSRAARACAEPEAAHRIAGALVHLSASTRRSLWGEKRSGPGQTGNAGMRS